MKKNYHELAFWDDKYKVGLYKNQQWLETATDSVKIFQQHISKQKDIKILELGCGTSNLAAQLYKRGYENIKCVDFCKEVIKHNKKKQNSSIEYAVQDITQMQNLQGESYDLIIDKCTIDCLFCATDQMRSVLRCMKQCYRILKQTGKMLIISHGRPKTRKFFLRNKIAPFESISHYHIQRQKQVIVKTIQKVPQTYNYLYVLKKTGIESDKEQREDQSQNDNVQQKSQKEQQENEKNEDQNQNSREQDQGDIPNIEENNEAQEQKEEEQQFILDGKKTIKNSNVTDSQFLLEKTQSKKQNEVKSKKQQNKKKTQQQIQQPQQQEDQQQDRNQQQDQYDAEFQGADQQNNQQQQQTEQTDFILM